MMRVLITRPSEQAEDFAEELSKFGAEVIFLPAIQIKPVDDTSILDRALTKLDCYRWLILTSGNAVDIILGRMAALGIDAPPKNMRIAAVGPKTAAKLQEGGFPVDFVPVEYTAEAVLPGLGDLRGQWVLLPLADIAHDTLPKAIQSADGVAHVITTYHTVSAEPDPKGLAALRDGVDMLTFTSGSTARNLFTMIVEAGLDPLQLPGNPQVACIGPKTAEAAQEIGFKIDIVAETFTLNGLAEAIIKQKIKN